jgi:hypothetical protein
MIDSGEGGFAGSKCQHFFAFRSWVSSPDHVPDSIANYLGVLVRLRTFGVFPRQ